MSNLAMPIPRPRLPGPRSSRTWDAWISPGWLVSFTHAQARWPLVLESFLRPVALLLSVPVWQLMGLM